MTFEILLTHPAVQILGRALLHFLWQGSLLALLLWMIKTVTPTSARVRYAAASLIMLAMPVALIVTVAQDLRQEQAVAKVGPMISAHAQALSKASPRALLAVLPAGTPSAGVTGWVVCIWIAGVLLLSLRAAGGWMRAQRLKRRVLPANAELEDMMTQLKRRLSVSAAVRLYTSAIVQVPTVIGWLRPYILLPVTTITGLSELQLRAVLAHELAHIRRHDYLVNLLQTAVETALFYHPAVWWVGKQMRLEREHCCDDVAVAVCGNAIEYAEALAELERIRGRAPEHVEPVLAATGGELLGRIRRLLGQRPSKDGALKSLGAVAAAALVLLLVAMPVVRTLSAAPQASSEPRTKAPEFDAVSVKLVDPNAQGEHSHEKSDPTRLTMTGTMHRFIVRAYGITDGQLGGEPDWFATRLYSIEGVASAPASEDKLMLMLRAALADRFQLKLRQESRDVPVFALEVAAGGPKFKELRPGEIQRDRDEDAPEGVYARNFPSTTALVTVLNGVFGGILRLDRTVVDRTQLTGRYDIRLRTEMEIQTDDFGRRTSQLPNLSRDIQAQLGLKLVPDRVSMPYFVVEQAAAPTPN